MPSIQIRRMTLSQVTLRLVTAGCLFGALCCTGLRGEPLLAEVPGGRAAVVVELAGIERAYADVKLAFDLAGDENGYTILKDTVDLFLGGVDIKKPCEYRVFATAGGLQSVASVPIDTDADFAKFLQYLWDVDVKTAPVPKPASIGHVPAAVRMRLQSLKLQPSERIVFSLMDGFMRHDAGYAHLGESLDSIRLARGRAGICSNGATLSMHIDGEAITSDLRRQAFQKSSHKALAELKRDDGVTEVAFAFQKALLQSQFARWEILFSESSQAQLDVVTSPKLKQLQVRAELTPAPGTSLANEVQGIGNAVDAFAAISRQGAALSCSLNLPINPAVGQSLANVIRCARVSIREHLEHASENDGDQKAADTEFADFVLDVADAAASMTNLNGMLRIWSDRNNTLTTVGALRIGDNSQIQKRIEAIKNQTVLHRAPGDIKVTIHKVPVFYWSRQYAELFDESGAMFVAVDQDCIWFAMGNNALERLGQALRETNEKGGATSETALDFHARMQPLSEVWSRVHLRHSVSEKKSKNSAERVKPSAANWASIVADLNLPKLAAEAFRKEPDSISVSLKRQADKVSLTAEFDAGTLRFIGKVLSKFVINNLN